VTRLVLRLWSTLHGLLTKPSGVCASLGSATRSRTFRTTIGLALVTMLLMQLAAIPSPVVSARSTSVPPSIASVSVERPPKTMGQAQETQAIRDARVARLHLAPDDVTVQLGERVSFAAIAQDAAGVPIGGVNVTWHAHDLKSGQQVQLTRPGEFTADVPGTYLIAALAGRHRADVTVRVLGAEGGDAALSEPLSVRPNPPVRRDTRPPRPDDREPRWDETTIPAASEPANRRGTNPHDAVALAQASLGIRRDRLEADSGAGSANFQLRAPVMNLAGRGLDVVLDLNYNSLLWHQVNDLMVFAPQLDDDWPAPGWSLGFGKVFGRMLIDADGTHHLLSGGPRDGHTTDGTFIDCSFAPLPGTAVQCRYPTGLVIDFNHFTNFGFRYPTRITDANGNYIVIAYRDLSLQPKLPPGRRVGPSIATITDTLGRTITFHYEPEVEANDFSGVLTAITGPGLNGQVRTLARFNWARRKLDAAFGGGRNISPGSPREIRVLKAVYYPGTATGYWFGDEDSYSSYGMIATVREQRAMGFATTPLTEQGVIEKGRTTRQQVYNYPLRPDTALITSPMYTTVTETWEKMNTGPAVTTYAVTRGISEPSKQPWQRVDVTYPDGTRSIRVHEGATPSLDEIYDANGKLLRRTKMLWAAGDYASPRPTRIEVTDDLGQLTASEFSYGPYNQVTELREYEYGGTALLRRTATAYVQDPRYIQRHIFNLPRVVEVFTGDGASPVSRTEFTYDGQPMSKAPGVIQHSQAFNPDAPPEWVPPKCKQVCWLPCTPPRECEPKCRQECENEGYWRPQYDQLTDYRGNLTQIVCYANAAERTEAIVEARRYDIVGNLVSATTGCCQRTGYSYTQATQYAYPTEQASGAVDPASPLRVTAAATYDFDTGLVLTATDANGRTKRMESSPTPLRPARILHPTGAPTSFVYDDDGQSVTVSTAGASATEAPGIQRTTWFNGLGLPVREAARADGGWDVVDTRYDQLGRPTQRSQPVRRTGDAATWPTPEWWNEIRYDGLGRVTSAQAPDGSTVSSVYNEAVRPKGATSEPGETLRTLDAWERWRWTRNDALGRLVEVIEPNPDGDGSLDGAGNLATTYRYDGLGWLTTVDQGEQKRLFQHDSLGRLRRQSLPERLATLDAAGSYVGAGGEWSDVFAYDDRSNLTSHTDARGVRTIYHYGDDPLGRVQAVTYDTSRFGDTKHPIAPAGGVSFTYVTTGDITRVDQVTIDGVGTQTYEYGDPEGRLRATSLELTSWPAQLLVVSYTYDSLDRVSDLRYPAGYNVGGAQRQHIHHEYGLAGRLMGIKLNGEDVASEMTYDAAGLPTSLEIGPAGPAQLIESYGFDSATGLPTGQQVKRAGTPLLDLSYEFLRLGKPGRSGQLTRLVDNLDGQKSRSYEYDALGRLVKAAGGDPTAPRWTQTYAYDRYGSRTGVLAAGTAANGQPIPPDGRTQVVYSPTTNRITSSGFTYDAAGNLTRARHGSVWRRYRYDAAGRLTQVLRDSGAALETYLYGLGGERLETQHATGPLARTYYVWAGNRLLSEYETPRGSAALRWARSNVYLAGRLLAALTPPAAQNQADAKRYHHPDRLGTRLVTNAADNTVGEQVSLPFGVALRAESTVAVNPRFTSYDRSAATGLDYAVNRFYDPEYGRFTQIDPLGMEAADPSAPQTMNLYAYVRNDPINAVDPAGLQDKRCSYTPGGKLVCCCIELTVTGRRLGDGSRRPLSAGDLSRGSPSGGDRIGGERSGAEGGSRTASLQEAIYRGLGGRGPFVPSPRPTTQLDLLLSGYLLGSFTFLTGGVLATFGGTVLGVGTFNPFVPGALFETTITTTAGEVGVLAEVEVVGSQLILRDLAIFGKAGALVNQVGHGAFLALRSQIARQAALAGYSTLRIIADRSAQSSSALPGKMIDITIRLGSSK
jgi:RHS repeat-associated protein